MKQFIYFHSDQPSSIVVTSGEHVSWKGSTCAGAAISYRVEVTPLNDSGIDVIVTNSTEITLTNLLSNQEYSISVMTVGSTCSSVAASTTFTFSGNGEGLHFTACVVYTWDTENHRNYYKMNVSTVR